MNSEVHVNRVLVNPLREELAVESGETLLAAAQRLGYKWPSVCGGQGNCTTCYVKIEQGEENVQPSAAQERERLDFAGRKDPSFRLACQMLINGPVTVIKRGIKRQCD